MGGLARSPKNSYRSPRDHETGTGEPLIENDIDHQRRSSNLVKWFCAIFSLSLLGLGIHLLSGGTTGDPARDSPWPYLALGALLAVRVLIKRGVRHNDHP